MRKILIGVLLLGLVGLQGVLVKAADTNLSQVMSAGSKSVGSAASADLSGLTATYTTQNATGNFIIDPKNAVGDGAKWDATATSTNFTTIGAVIKTVGANSTVGKSGTYDGTYGVVDPVKKYTVEITTGGAVGAAVFKWRVNAETWTETVTTAASVVLEKGISVTFATATYVIGDQWQFGVDVFPYTGLTVTPQSVTADSGSATGLTAGSAEALAGSGVTSDAKTLITGDYYRGMGDYAQTENLSLSVHANPIAGTYSAVATVTGL
ncbi:MAG: hypothetical protein Q8N56_01635 [bacterium]|nr:hypothetical protein [bacterium]